MNLYVGTSGYRKEWNGATRTTGRATSAKASLRAAGKSPNKGMQGTGAHIEQSQRPRSAGR